MRLDRTRGPNPYDQLPVVPSFPVTSSDISHGEPLPLRHVTAGAGGDDVSPQLAWSGAPAATQSFAVTCYDPDAPTTSGWWHWQLVNLPADLDSLPRGAGSPDGALLPPGAVQFRNDYGFFGFGGAGPPAGDMAHRYFFAVHALDVPHLDLDRGTPNAIVGFQLVAHTLARGLIVATYEH